MFYAENNISQVLAFMNAELGLKVPYGYVPGRSPGDEIETTQAAWDAYTWNPPAALATITPDVPPGATVPDYTVPDPNADPKPTWAEILLAQKKYETRYHEMVSWIDSAEKALTNLRRWTEQKRTEQIRSLRVSLSTGAIIPGHRIERIPNLVALSQQEELGTTVQLRDVDEKLVNVTDRLDLVTYVSEISVETNRLHNVEAGIFADLQPHLRRMRDTNISISERIQAARIMIAAGLNREERLLPRFQG